MRPEPGMAPPDLRWKKVQTLSLEVELITRLFGGGALTKELDEVCWLRSSAAKSAIRSWWRAAKDHAHTSIAALRQEEATIFGAPGTYDRHGRLQGGPGPLAVRTERIHSPAPVLYDLLPPNPLSVAYFPGSGMGEDPSKLLPAGARAWVHTEFGEDPATPQDKDRAIRLGLRAWLLLGGAGARTRRGAGALALKSAEGAEAAGLPANQKALREQLAELCARRSLAPGLDAVFSLSRTRAVLLGTTTDDPEEAQRQLLGALREARQDRKHPAIWDGAAGWGRSRWPEADAIRLFEAEGSYDHEPDGEHANQFPRTALGLPLGMKFKAKPGGREPGKHEVTAKLNPEAPLPIERYASPILLRPVRVWEGTKVVYVPVAIFTECLLPKTARPWVKPEDARGRKQPAVASFEIRKNADATLERVESVFRRFGFKPL